MLALAASLLCACASEPKTTPLSPQQQALNVESYDKVWSKIKERHFDPAKVGDQWDAEHAKLRPQVEQAKTMAQARAASNQLIGSLHQSHFGIIPGDVYDEMKGGGEAPPESGSGDWSGNPGFELRAVGGEALVIRVEPKSPADLAGVKPGWVLVSAEKRDVGAMIAKFEKNFAGKLDKGLTMSVALRTLIRGEEGKPLHAEFLDGQDQRVALTIDRVAPTGTPVTFGNLPTLYLDIRRSMATDRIGYFFFSIWFDPPRLMPELQKAIEACDSCEGFILDLRGNIGGIGALAMGVGGWFIDQPDQKLGTLITRDSKLNFVLNPRLKPFTGPFAILVDEMSASTSEIFAGGMQDLGRARVFGTPTPGAALPSTVEVLPNGDRLQYAFANYISAKGEALEAKGVIPDEIVPLSREKLLEQGDPVLKAAIEWIQSQTAAKARAKD